MENQRLFHLLAMQKENPGDAFLGFAIALEYRKLGQPERAIESLEELRENHPDYIGLYYHLGKLYESVPNPYSAEIVYKDGIARAENAGDFHALSELKSALVALTESFNNG